MTDSFETRFTHGGDEWILAELDEEMSLGVNVRAQAICQRLQEQQLGGLVDICCSNASYLLRLDPDVFHPLDAVEHLKSLEAEVGDASDFHLQTRVSEVPILWEDEWTHGAVMRSRDRHQTPDLTDIEFAARQNGFSSKEAFKEAVCAMPFLGTMTGFVPGATWWYPLAPPGRQIEVPKYVRPRTETPERAFGWGGTFAVVYPVQGAGGYQLFGISAVPQLDTSRRLPDFRDTDWFFGVGDLIVFTPVDRAGFDAIRAEVEAERFRYRSRPFEFVSGEWNADPDAVNASIVRTLYGT